MLRTGLNDVKFNVATILHGLHRAAPLDFIGFDQLPYLQDAGRICDPIRSLYHFHKDTQ